ncbi:hypothetical protein ACJJTC_011010 [Scirpophaga incertulas]
MCEINLTYYRSTLYFSALENENVVFIFSTLRTHYLIQKMNKAFFLVFIASASAHVVSFCEEDSKLQHHEHDCAKYYKCAHNRRLLLECKPGTLFDIRTQSCTWSFLVDCKSKDDIDYQNALSLDSLSNNELYSDYYYNSYDNVRLNNKINYRFNPSRRSGTSPKKLPNGCPADFSIHYLLPHETDCSKFYSCGNGIKYSMQCAQGTLFDQSSQICNWPSLVNCHSGVSTTTASILSSSISTTSRPTSIGENDDKLSNGCPADFAVHQLLPHETDCGKFYSCSNGNKIAMNCAPGTLFDFKNQICDWPHSVQCLTTTSSSTITSTTNMVTTIRSTSTTISPKTTTLSSKITTDTSLTVNESTAINSEATTTELVDNTTETMKPTSDDSTTSQDSSTIIPIIPTNNPISTDLVTSTTPDISTMYTTSETKGSTADNSNISSIASTTSTSTSTVSESTFNTQKPTTITHETSLIDILKTTTEESEFTISLSSTTSENSFTSGIDQSTNNNTIDNSSTLTTFAITENPKTTSITSNTEYDETIITESTTMKYTGITENLSSNVTLAPDSSVGPEISTLPETSKDTTTQSVSSKTTVVPDSTVEPETSTLPEGSTLKTTENVSSQTTVVPDSTTEPEISTLPQTSTQKTTEDITSNATVAPDSTVEPELSTLPQISTQKTTEDITSNATEVPDSTLEPETSTLAQITTKTTENDSLNATIVTESSSNEIVSKSTTNAYSTTILYTTYTSTVPISHQSTTEGTSDTVQLNITIDNEKSTTNNYITSTDNLQFESTSVFITTTKDTESDSNTTTTQGANNATENTEYMTTDSIIQPTAETTSFTSNVESTEMTEPTSTVSDLTSTTKAPLCPIGVFGNIPHPSLCNSFYMCAGGSAIQLFCREGFEFDPVIKSCVLIAPGGCTLGDLTTPAAITTNTFTPEENANTTNPTSSTTPLSIETTTLFDYTKTSYTTSQNSVTTDIHTNIYSTTEDISEISRITSNDTETTMHLTTTTEDVNTSNIPVTHISTIDINSTEFVTTTEYTSKPTETTPIDIHQDTTMLTSKDTTTEETTERTTDLSSSAEVTDIGNTPTATIQTTTEGERYEKDFTSTVKYNSTAEEIPSTSIDGKVTTDSAFTSTTTNMQSTTAAPLCPPGVFGNIPHPNLCNSFYMCAGGVPVQLFCRDGFEFDAQIKSCVVIAPGGCSNPPAIATESTTELNSTDTAYFTTLESKSTMELTLTSNSDEVTSTTTGEDNMETSTSKLTSSTAYVNEDTNNFTESITTTVAPLCPPGTFGNVPHPDLCNSFYMCVGGIATQLFCREGFEFSPISKNCVQITDGGCTLGNKKTVLKRSERAASNSGQDSQLDSEREYAIKYTIGIWANR